MDIIRAALYIRVSTEEQVREGYSVEAQRDNLKRYAKNKGYSVVGVYADEGITARKKYTNRKEFMRLLDDVEAGKIDIILFIKLDRWFRNVGDYYKIQEILERNNVGWTATTENYDTTTANGRLYVNIRLAVAQDESDRTSERIKFVFEKKVADGEAIWGLAPFGYKVENKKVVIDEDLYPIVVDIFEAFIKLRSVNSVCVYINEKYGTHYSYNIFKRILRDNTDFYYGTYRNNTSYCPPYLSKAQYEIIREISDSTTTIRSSGKKYDYIFSGLLECGYCGRRLVGGGSTRKDNGKAYYGYRCTGYRGGTCSNRISELKVESLLFAALEDEVKKYKVDYEIKQKKKKPAYINKSSIEKKIARLRNLYLNEVIEIDDYTVEYRKLQDKLREYEESINKVEDNKDFTALDNLLKSDFKEIYNNLSNIDKRTLWHSVIKRIIVKDKQIQEIIFK